MKTASSSSDNKLLNVLNVLPSMKVQMAMQHVFTAVCKIRSQQLRRNSKVNEGRRCISARKLSVPDCVQSSKILL